MIVCPACKSSSICNDFKPAPFTLRIVGIRALLCDHCNHQFRAFCLILPKRRPAHDTKRLTGISSPAPLMDMNRVNQSSDETRYDQTTRIIINRFPRLVEHQPTVSGELITSERNNLRTQVTKLNEPRTMELLAQNGTRRERER